MKAVNRLFPSELVVFGVTGGAIALYFFFRIPLRYPFMLYVQRLSGGMAWYLTGLVLCLLLARLSHIAAARKETETRSWLNTWSQFRASYLGSRVLLRDLRLVHVLCLFFVVFMHLKHLTPIVNSALYDEQFAATERAMFGGRLCSEVIIEMLEGSVSGFLSWGYVFFYPYLGLLLMTMVLQRDERAAHEFCLSFVLVWFIGMLLVFLIPTWGPCFSHPELFELLPGTRVTQLQQGLWEMKQHLDVFPKSDRGIFLISGFPSLHLAAVVLGSLYFGRIHWFLGLCSWAFALLTVVTTLYFGWHFLLDDVGALVLVLVVYGVVSRARGSCRVKDPACKACDV